MYINNNFFQFISISTGPIVFVCIPEVHCKVWIWGVGWHSKSIFLLTLCLSSLLLSVCVRACICTHVAYMCWRRPVSPELEACVCFLLFTPSSPCSNSRRLRRVQCHQLISSAEINSMENPNKQRQGEIFVLRLDLARIPLFPGSLVPCPNRDGRECTVEQRSKHPFVGIRWKKKGSCLRGTGRMFPHLI